jgi:hypothetical protein
VAKGRARDIEWSRCARSFPSRQGDACESAALDARPRPPHSHDSRAHRGALAGDSRDGAAGHDPVRAAVRRGDPRAGLPRPPPGVPDDRRGAHHAWLRADRARGGGRLAGRAGRPGRGGGGGRLRPAHAGDHGAGRRRGHPGRGRVGADARPGGARADGRADPPQAPDARPQRDVHRGHVPGGGDRRDRPAPRGALPARHGLLAGGARRPDRHLGRRREHDRLPEVPGHAARPGRRLGLAPRLRGDGAADAEADHLRLRPGPVEASVGAGRARRGREGGRAPEPAGLDPDPPDPGAPGGDPDDPRGGAAAPDPAPPDRRQGVPRRRGGSQARSVRRARAGLRHRLVLPHAPRDRGGRGDPADARRLRHPDLDRHRDRPDASGRAAGRDDGHDSEPALRAADAVGPRDGPPRPRVQGRHRGGAGGGAGDLRRGVAVTRDAAPSPLPSPPEGGEGEEEAESFGSSFRTTSHPRSPGPARSRASGPSAR